MTIPSTASTWDVAQILKRYETACQDLQAGDWSRAQRGFEDLANAAPMESRFYFGLGLCLQQQAQWARATRQFAICVNLNPSDAASTFRLAECLEAAGETADARESYQDALKLCALPESPPELRGLIEARLQDL